MLRNAFILIIGIIVINGCCPDDDLGVTYAPINCADNIIDPIRQNLCSGTVTNSQYCEVIQFGTYELELESKDFSYYYCQSIGEIFKYENMKGDEMSFELVTNEFAENAATFNSFIPCEADSTKTTGYCINRERISSVLSAIDFPLGIRVEIATNLDFRNPELIGLGDELSILTNSSRSFTVLLLARNLETEEERGQEFYDNIDLLGTNFSDVYSQDISNYVNPVFKYYYSKKDGLIAFVDDEGELWRKK